MVDPSLLQYGVPVSPHQGNMQILSRLMITLLFGKPNTVIFISYRTLFHKHDCEFVWVLVVQIGFPRKRTLRWSLAYRSLLDCFCDQHLGKERKETGFGRRSWAVRYLVSVQALAKPM